MRSYQLYTKAYEFFKKYAPARSPEDSTQPRMTAWIAYRVAHTYHDLGKYDLAIR
jgi:trafficking protein particle complex subunit 11